MSKRKRPAAKGAKVKASLFKLTPEMEKLYSDLKGLYENAYYFRNGMPEDASPAMWEAERARMAMGREVFKLYVEKRLGKHARPGRYYRAPKLRSFDQLLELAIIGAFRLEGDRMVAQMIREAAGLRL